MKHAHAEMRRRTLLQSAMGLAIGQLGLCASNAVHAGEMPSSGGGAGGSNGDSPSGGISDFNFLSGTWKISNRRLKGEDWDEFDGEATVWSVLGGIGSVEELRIPARNFSGCGIRLFDADKKLWADYWVNARNGQLSAAPTWGGFKDSVGTWIADDKDGDTPIKVRGVWDRITPTSCRWHQAISRDEGKTWAANWTMDWTRV
jgi:hypothetical protein